MERRDPDLQADERAALEQFLDYQRATLLRKVEGLTREQMARRVGASSLTLAGLVKHLALVEDAWFVETFAGRPLPEPWLGVDFDEDPEWEFRTALDEEPAALVALYEAACARSRAVVAGAGTLDDLSVLPSRREGIPFRLRWILLHMIEETARHNGHADLLREAIDGAVGE